MVNNLVELKYQTRSEEAGMLEERYAYTVVPRRPIRGLVKGKVLTRSIVLSLTKDEVLYCLKYANVYRKFFPTSKQERVTPKSVDRLHRPEYMSEAQYEALNNNESEDIPEVSKQIEENKEESIPVVEEEVIEEVVETEVEEEPIEDTTDEEEVVEEESKKEDEEQSPTEYSESEYSSTEDDSVEEMTEYSEPVLEATTTSTENNGYYSVSTDKDEPLPEVTNTTASYTGYTSKSSRKKKKYNKQHNNYNQNNTNNSESTNAVPEN